jgi:hypothetical protein
MAVADAWSGSPCDYNVFAGSISWSGSTPQLFLGYNSSSGFNSYDPASTSAGTEFDTENVYWGSGSYAVMDDGYEYGFTGLGGGTCYATAGLDIQTEGVPISSVSVGNTTWGWLNWWDTSRTEHTGYNTDYISNACGSSPAGSCLNGAYYFGTDLWQANKP